MSTLIPELMDLKKSWGPVYRHCQANQGAVAPYLKGVALKDLDDFVSSLAKWGGTLKSKTSKLPLFRVSRDLVRAQIKALMADFERINAGDFSRTSNLPGSLATAMSAVYVLTVTNPDLEKPAVEEAVADLLQLLPMIEKSNAHLASAMERYQNASSLYDSLSENTQQAKSLLANIVKANSKVTDTLATIETRNEEIESQKKLALDKNSELAKIVGEANQIKEEAKKLEERLRKLAEQAKVDQVRIGELLPGAASAALSSSFSKRVRELNISKRAWSFGFVAAIGALIALVFFFPPPSGHETQEMYIYLLERIPLAGPLIWFGWVCVRQYGHVIRVQEDYAFKDAMSIAFEGYKKQMKEIDGKLVKELSTNVLTILSRDPLRSFERGRDESPATDVLRQIDTAKVAATAVRPAVE